MLQNFKSIILSLSLLAIGTCIAMEPEAQFQECHVMDFDFTRDMPDIYPIWQHDWDKLFMGKPYDPKIVEQWMSPKADESEEIKKTKVLRLLEKTIGFANYYKRHTSNDVYMDTGAVAKEYQHHGLGKHFMPAIIQDAKAMGVKEVLVDVSKDNAPMLALCARYGFVIFGSTLRDKAHALKLELKD